MNKKELKEMWQEKSLVFDKKEGRLIHPENNMNTWDDKDILEIWKTIEFDYKEINYNKWGGTILKLALKFKRTWYAIEFILRFKCLYLSKFEYIKVGKSLPKYRQTTKSIKTGKWKKLYPNKNVRQMIRLLERDYEDEIKWRN